MVILIRDASIQICFFLVLIRIITDTENGDVGNQGHQITAPFTELRFCFPALHRGHEKHTCMFMQAC